MEGKGKGVQALAGVLHGGEERLVVVLVVRAPAAVAVAVGSSHLPHYPPDSGLRKGKGRERRGRMRGGEGNGGNGWMWSSATHSLS